MAIGDGPLLEGVWPSERPRRRKDGGGGGESRSIGTERDDCEFRGRRSMLMGTAVAWEVERRDAGETRGRNLSMLMGTAVEVEVVAERAGGGERVRRR